MWTRGDLTENHLITTDKQLDTKQPITAQCQHHFTGNLLRTFKGKRAHLLWLPGFTVVAIFLAMTYWCTEMDAIHRADG